MSQPEWRRIVPPPRLARRPRDPRGFIIPYSVDDGTAQPDFRMTQPDRIRELFGRHGCWLCGEALDYWQCFIGGPLSIANRMFTDGPMHEACAVYALRVCPFLASPTGRYSSSPEDAPNVNPHMASTRPERFGLGFTRGYQTGIDPSGHLYLHADPFRKVLWYSAHGELLDAQINQTTRYERKRPRYRLARPSGR